MPSARVDEKGGAVLQLLWAKWGLRETWEQENPWRSGALERQAVLGTKWLLNEPCPDQGVPDSCAFPLGAVGADILCRSGNGHKNGAAADECG